MGNQADFLGLLGLVRSVRIVTYYVGSSDLLQPVFPGSYDLSWCRTVPGSMENQADRLFKLVAFYRLKCIGKSMASNEQLHSKLAKNCDFS